MPSAFITYTSQAVVSRKVTYSRWLRVKRMRRPSGEKREKNSTYGVFVSRRTVSLFRSRR